MYYYNIVEVADRKSEAGFYEIQTRLYKDDPNWIQPLDIEIKKIFDPKKNKMFLHGKLCRWIAQDNSGETVGRVAAFIDFDTAGLNEQPTGGIGFFECINDTNVAFALFEQCKLWLKMNGMEAMDGPVNFGSRERWWGLLVDGFTEPSYGMNYHLPYYKDLFEAYGFKNYFYQYSYLRPVSTENLSPLFKEKAERVARNPEYHFKHIDKKKLKHEAEVFRRIYNKSWVNHSGIKEMSEEDAASLVRELKPVIDERLIIFLYHNEEPIGFFVQIPEINQIIKHLNGKFSFPYKLKFMYLLKRKKVCTRIIGLIFAIVPEYRGFGLESALVMAFAETAFGRKFPYKDIDLTWVGDFNPLMMRFQEQIGGKIYKTHATYRLLFDEEKQKNEFKRCPKMGKQNG
jgi:GNAT superfamily N-acetyltransferase